MLFFPPPSTPVEMLKLTVRSTMMLAEAQTVIALRLMGMAGIWRLDRGCPAEQARMVAEKFSAAHEAGRAAGRAVMAGLSAAAVADQALKPIRRRTRANARRLAKGGPAMPA